MTTLADTSSLSGTADWELWSTTARVVVTRPEALGVAVDVTREVLADVERAASRFHAGSELLDLKPGRTTVGPTLARLLAVALDTARRTDGAVDPTVGSSLEALGYDRDIAVLRRDGARTAVRLRPAPGWRRVHLSGRQITVPVGLRLDLGATAKAVAADWCAEAVHARTGAGVLVCLGGDVATAGEAPAGGWRVTVQDAVDDRPVDVALDSGVAMATSSTRRRVWQHGDRSVHHLVDPRTGDSARSPWSVVSVVARSCADANAASTATVVKAEHGADWLASTGLPARLLADDGSVLVLGDWPAEVVSA